MREHTSAREADSSLPAHGTSTSAVTGPAAAASGKARFLGRIGGRYSWTALIWLWLIYAMNANTRSWITTVQPALVEEFHLSATTMGTVSGILNMGMGAAAIAFSPWLARGEHGWARKYRHLPIVAVYLVFSVLTGVTALTGVFGAVFVFQLIKSFGNGIGEAAEVTAVAEWWPLERRGFAQGLHHTAFPWGTLLGGLGVTAIYTMFGSANWRYVFLVMPLLVIPMVFFYWRFANASNYQKFIADTKRRGPLSDSLD
jgi:MFS family permease